MDGLGAAFWMAGDTRLEPERETAGRDIGRVGWYRPLLYAEEREFGEAMVIGALH